jgi:hypothetical protein
LAGDARDALGSHHGTATGVTWVDGPDGSAKTAARFTASAAEVRVADAPELRLGNNDFTIALRAKCDVPVRSVGGDLISKFDPEVRCGFNLSIDSSASAYCGMSDARHVRFGIDDGYIGPWEDCGRPTPSNPLITNLIVHDGALYCGSADAAEPMDACRVYRWTGGKQWQDCGRLGDNPNHLSVQSMCVHEGQLYSGTGVWDWVRACPGVRKEQGMGDAGTRVFVYEGGTEWRDLGAVGSGIRVHCLASYAGALYAGIDRAGDGHCFRYTGDGWADCGSPNGDSIQNLFAFDGALYAATHGFVYRYEGGSAWACIAEHPHGVGQIHCLQVFGDSLWAGTWPEGYMLRRDADGDWCNTGRLGIAEGLSEINEINALCPHNGKLYAGVLPKGQIYRYDSDGHWTLLTSLASRPDYDEADVPTWNRVTCITSFQDRLFAGTGTCRARTVDLDADRTCGRVAAAAFGQTVAYEHDIGSGWTDIVVTRARRMLRLFINGQEQAVGEGPQQHWFDLANTEPLLIGRGSRSAFAGAIADVRLYNVALSPEAIRELGQGSGV